MTALPRAAALTAAVALLAGGAVAGCGEDQQAPDLFLLTRTGQGTRLTLLVNAGGSVRCDGRAPKPISDQTLIAARDLADDLGKDAAHGLRLPPSSGTVFYYQVKLQQGTIAFPDRAAAHRRELGRATLMAAQLAQHPCGLSG